MSRSGSFVHGWTVLRKEPGKAVRLCTGCTVLRKEPGKAVRLCTGCTVCRGAMDGKERRMSMEGRTDICSCNICTSTIRGGRIAQGARDSGVAWRGVSVVIMILVILNGCV